MEKQISGLRPSRGRRWARYVFLVTAILIGILSLVCVARRESDGFSLPLSLSMPHFAALIIVAVVIMLLNWLKLASVAKSVTGSGRFRNTLKATFVGKYYDAVTPFSSGGQPMQALALTEGGVGGAKASAIVLVRYFVSTLGWLFSGAVFLTVGTACGVLDGVGGGSFLLTVGWLGFAVNAVVPTALFFFLIMPRVMRGLTVKVVRAGCKLRLVKSEEAATARAQKVTDAIREALKIAAKKPTYLVAATFTGLAEAVLTFTLPYFVIAALGCGDGVSFITVAALNAFALFSSSVVPTPGNAGAAEGIGALAFSAVAGGALTCCVLVWRFFTFYIYVIIGICISVRDLFKR